MPVGEQPEHLTAVAEAIDPVGAGRGAGGKAASAGDAKASSSIANAASGFADKSTGSMDENTAVRRRGRADR